MTYVIKFFKGRDFLGSLPFYSFSIILLCLILCGCITEYTPKEMVEMVDILVVEGIITDGTSMITLSRSKELSYEDDLWNLSPYHVTDAKVWIECDNGQQWASTTPSGGGQYAITTGALQPGQQYRLKIEHEAHAYVSEYAAPLQTPDIDSVFWTKYGTGQLVHIHVATHASDDAAQYYRWTYQEVWEIRPYYYEEDKGECSRCRSFVDQRDIFCPNCGFELTRQPYYCWNTAMSREMLIGSAEKTVMGRVAEQLVEITPTDLKLKILYRIDVQQNVIRKRTYYYYNNLKKNVSQTGGLFAHTPAELKGNIRCTTDPSRPVIGYVEVSFTATKRLWIARRDDAYERDPRYCTPIYINTWLGGIVPAGYVPIGGGQYVNGDCYTCLTGGATKYKPDDWPEED